jgi:hypothetical protein
VKLGLWHQKTQTAGISEQGADRRDEIIGEEGKLSNGELRNFYFSMNIIRTLMPMKTSPSGRRRGIHTRFW